MRLLFVNGNTTQAVTDHVVRIGRSIAPADVEIVGVTARFGANIVTAEPENIIASHAVLELLAEYCADFDAAILTISFDSGLFAARDLVPIPVVGMTEAALNAAASEPGKIGVIVFGNASLPLYKALFDRLPVCKAIGAIRVIDIASVEGYLDTGKQEAAVLAEVAALQRSHWIDRVVICGAAMAGLATKLQPQTASQLFDGIPCAIADALRRVGEGRIQPRDALARTSIVTGLSPALEALFARRNRAG